MGFSSKIKTVQTQTTDSGVEAGHTYRYFRLSKSSNEFGQGMLFDLIIVEKPVKKRFSKDFTKQLHF